MQKQNDKTMALKKIAIVENKWRLSPKNGVYRRKSGDYLRKMANIAEKIVRT
jgi:hypothetical protein